MMKQLFYISAVLLFTSCVPLKKYQDLESNYKKCQEEDAGYKTKALDAENQLAEIKSHTEVLEAESIKLKEENEKTLGNFNRLQAEYDRVSQTNEVLEQKYAKVLSNGSIETAKLINDLEKTRIELQQKEDRLNALEKELNKREKVLAEKEARIAELETIIREQELAVERLRAQIAEALIGFKDKGITVEERDGKIYISMEAKLLFASGKTNVNPEGESALVDLSKVLETQKDVDIIVEGHTDSDAMNSSAHPKDNWELSVLRATSVVKIMLSNSAMDAQQITAAGRSEFHPVDPNDKAKNRRIEIIIAPDLSKLFELISAK
jgi:chemotaxis protein MotB